MFIFIWMLNWYEDKCFLQGMNVLRDIAVVKLCGAYVVVEKFPTTVPTTYNTLQNKHTSL